MKTSELTGAALDWAVAKAEGHIRPDGGFYAGHQGRPLVRYSTDWAQAGPIIERIKGFHLKGWLDSTPETAYQAEIHNYGCDWVMFGPTPLIAAMRCYVASALGDEVDVPKELMS